MNPSERPVPSGTRSTGSSTPADTELDRVEPARGSGAEQDAFGHEFGERCVPV